MRIERHERPVLGLLINQIEGRYQSLITRGLTDLARERDVGLRIFVGRSLHSPYGIEDLFNGIYSLARGLPQGKAPDGLVVAAGSVGSFLPPEQIRAFLDSFAPIPLATIGIEVGGYPGISTDNRKGTAELVRHLLQVHGFRRFAFLKGPDQSPDALERLESWREALAENGISGDSAFELTGDFSYSSGNNAAQSIDLSAGIPFDVISCANDDMAFGFMKAMEERGFNCPRDYAITGFDDIPDAGFLSPLLTTVRQPLREQAYAAGELVLAAIAGEGKREGASLSATTPVIRESCGCADMPLITGRRNVPHQREDRRESAKAAILEILPAALGLFPAHATEAIEAASALYDAASIDLRKFVDRPLFLQTLAGWLDVTLGWDEFSSKWHALLSLLHRELLNALADQQSRLYAEDLFANAFALLTRKAGERHARELSDLRNALHLFRNLSLKLGAVHDTQGLAKELAAMAPSIGFDGITIALHGSGSKPLTGKEDRDFYHDVNEIVCIDNQCGTETAYLPLLVADRSHGYIALSGKGVDPLVYESLREQVSHTLDTIANRAERESIDASRKESEERYRDIAAAVPIMILETDVMLRILYANPIACETLHVGPEEGFRSLKSFIAADDRVLADDIVRRLPSIRELDYPGVRLVNERNKKYIPVVRVSGKFDERGNLVSLRWNALDPLPFLKDGILPDRSFFSEKKITDREREIVELQLQGFRIRDIADRLCIAESTVKGHLTQVYNKLGITGKAELVQLLTEEQVGKLGFSAYVFSLVNRLLSMDDE